MKYEFLIKYIESTYVFFCYVNSIMNTSEEVKKIGSNILEPDYILGTKVATVCNILSIIKEGIVVEYTKNINNKQNKGFLSKVLDEAINISTLIIAKEDNKQYNLSNYVLSAPEILAQIRNRLDHGNFIIDFSKKEIIIYLNKQEIRIKVDKLVEYIRSNVKNYLFYQDINEYKKGIVEITKLDEYRTKPVVVKGEIKHILKNTRYTELTLKNSNGLKLEKNVIDYFLYKISLYNDTLDINIINDLEKNLQTKGYELIREHKKIPKYEFDKIIDDTKIFTSRDTKLSYHNQITYLGEYLSFYFDKNNKQITLLNSYLSILQLLEGIECTKSLDLNKIFLNNDFKYDPNLIITSSIILFNSLFMYPYNNLYKNSDLANTGFPYEKLDTSLLKYSKITYNYGIKEKEKYIIGLDTKIKEAKERKAKTELNLSNINKEKQDIVLKITNTLEKLKKDIQDLENGKEEKTKELIDLKNYIVNNKSYLTNKAIIEGLRNSIAHGGVSSIFKSGFHDTIICFENVYENNLSFKLDITLEDFVAFLENNLSIVIDYLKTFEKDKKSML